MPIAERYALTVGTLADGGSGESSLNFRSEPRWAGCEQKEHHQDYPKEMSTGARPLSKLSCSNRNHSRETNHFLKAANQENVTILEDSKELTSPVGRTLFP